MANSSLARSNFPRSLRKRLTGAKIVQDAGFSGLWKLQSTTAGWITLAFAAVLNPWIAVAGMSVWGMVATHFYERSQDRGFPNLLEIPAIFSEKKREKDGILACSLSWIVHTLKVIYVAIRMYIFDVRQFVFFRVFGAWLKPNTGCKIRRKTRSVILAASMMLFGVIANHQALTLAGFSRRHVYWGNMFARITNIPVKVLETTIVLSALFMLLEFTLQRTGPLAQGVIGLV